MSGSAMAPRLEMASSSYCFVLDRTYPSSLSAQFSLGHPSTQERLTATALRSFHTSMAVPTQLDSRIIQDVLLSKRYSRITTCTTTLIRMDLTDRPSMVLARRQKLMSARKARNSNTMCRVETTKVRPSSHGFVSSTTCLSISASPSRCTPRDCCVADCDVHCVMSVQYMSDTPSHDTSSGMLSVVAFTSRSRLESSHQSFTSVSGTYPCPSGVTCMRSGTWGGILPFCSVGESTTVATCRVGRQ
mmetsp:Transcript_20823/g.79832  ORF Transcript_20823/g.79832 Transcript_20823/m.79832 type:complete len:245 (-) Transcript_20823:1272-2006(-)